jgi:crotonobetainyl-CoA:carnitine CoA-transferase CaiB-like acyl-CoA transferase
MTEGAAGFMTIAYATLAAGERVARGDQRLTGRYPCYRVYDCMDGRHYSVAALEPKFWRTLCEALDRPDLLDQQYSEDLDSHRAVEEIFMTRTRDDWQQQLAGLDVCCEPVLDVDEVDSRLRQARPGRAPELGEHTEELLREVGL